MAPARSGRDRAGLCVLRAHRAARARGGGQNVKGRVVGEVLAPVKPQPARAMIGMAGKKLGEKIVGTHAEKGEPLV